MDRYSCGNVLPIECRNYFMEDCRRTCFGQYFGTKIQLQSRRKNAVRDRERLSSAFGMEKGMRLQSVTTDTNTMVSYTVR